MKWGYLTILVVFITGVWSLTIPLTDHAAFKDQVTLSSPSLLQFSSAPRLHASASEIQSHSSILAVKSRGAPARMVLTNTRHEYTVLRSSPPRARDSIIPSDTTTTSATPLSAQPNSEAKLSHIVIIVCILFGLPLALCIGLWWIFPRCGKESKDDGKDSKMDEGYDDKIGDFPTAADAVRLHDAAIRRSKRHSIGIGLGIDMGPRSPTHHSPRRPSPLRHVFTAHTKRISLHPIIPTHPLPPSAFELSSLASPLQPEGPASRQCRHSPGSPYTPEVESMPITPRSDGLDVPLDSSSVLAKGHSVPSARIEQDISDAYDACFVLGEYDDEDALVGVAHWYTIAQPSAS